MPKMTGGLASQTAVAMVFVAVIGISDLILRMHTICVDD
jgi:hypothetical protein